MEGELRNPDLFHWLIATFEQARPCFQTATNPASVALCQWMHDVEEKQLKRRMPTWAEDWAAELTAVYESTSPERAVKHQRLSDDDGQALSSASPVVSAEPTCAHTPTSQQHVANVIQSGPWSQPSPEVLTHPQKVVEALTTWGEMLAKVPFSQRENLIITFEPIVPIRSEAQLHSRVAAMGIPVFAKGTSPTQCPFGIQGGQAGQQSVAITLNREPAAKFTIQRQGRKDNIVLKGKRVVFEVHVVLCIVRCFGAPSCITSRCYPSSDATADVPASKPLVAPARKGNLLNMWSGSAK